MSSDEAFPAIVYYRLNPETVTVGAGPFVTALSVRYECRAKMAKQAEVLAEKVLAALRGTGRLIRIGTGLDDFDEKLEIYRHIQSVTLLN